MYSYLRGIYKGPAPDGDGAILLEAGGVGYEVLLPPIVESEVITTRNVDESLLLYVSAQAGRDQPWPILFGFLRPEQKAFWELLKSVPRVGGKGAARAMILPIDQIAAAIQQGNRAFLDGLPGVTVDGADKMIASLRKKVSPFVEAAEVTPARHGPVDDVRDDAITLLTQMGLKRLDAVRAVNTILASAEDVTSVQDIVTEYLRLHREGRSR